MIIKNSLSDEIVLEEDPINRRYSEGPILRVSTEELRVAGDYLAEVTFDVLGVEEDSDEYHLTASSAISEC